MGEQHAEVQRALLAIFRMGLRNIPKAKVGEMRESVDTIVNAFAQSTHMNEVLLEKCTSLQTHTILAFHANDGFQKRLQLIQSK